jgi:hypothetical protein
LSLLRCCTYDTREESSWGSERIIHDDRHRPRGSVQFAKWKFCHYFSAKLAEFCEQSDAIGGAQIGLAAASVRFKKVGIYFKVLFHEYEGSQLLLLWGIQYVPYVLYSM